MNLAKNVPNSENVKTLKDAMNSPEVKNYIDECISKCNEKAISRAHYIRKWAFIPKDFTMEDGLLTPTMKMKRKVIENRYQDLIEKLYQEQPKL
jgi:long-subunit acyl-CoA synthetase (AMP-forming)